MKTKYFGYEFRPAVTLFAHKTCESLGLDPVEIEWSDYTQTACINQSGSVSLANVKDDAVLTQGDNYLFTVEASGAAPLTYQWRKDAVPVAGATTASLALNAAKAADQGAYSVVVTNAQSSATSAAAAMPQPIDTERLENTMVPA